MLPTPSLDDIIEGVQYSLQADILPAIDNPKAQAMLSISLGVLQMVRQMLPVYDQNMIREHNDMARVHRDVAAMMARTAGPAADRLRARGADLGARTDYPEPIDRDEVREAHILMTNGLVDSMRDLDVLQRQGDEAAERALGIIRAHLGPRTMSDVATHVVGAGMVGRG
jgi:hypothetical protein